MDNIIYDNLNCQIQVTNICVYDNKVYLVIKLINNSEKDIQFHFGVLFRKEQYKSKVTGIHRYLGRIPSRGQDDYYPIPYGYFQEVQLVFDSYTINNGDEFNFCGYFCDSYTSIDYIFRYSDEGWTVTLMRLGGTAEPPIEIETIKLSFSSKNEETNCGVGLDNAIQCLDSLIGLQSVKEEVKTLVNFVKIQTLRKSRGLTSSTISYHCVFTGNPGTGKTTVARIIASIYRDLGILKRGHLVETDRSGLVGGYVGQTALKTNSIIDSAIDGVLFIDEAYTLANSETNNDFGPEAIATLLKRMEDDRDRLIVIIAGYSDKMREFINSNPGLKSRFIRYIDFPDYSQMELYEIFSSITKSEGYKISKQAEDVLQNAIKTKINSGDKDFGNGRYVRNVFEEAIKSQANRIVSETNIDNEELMLITEKDISIAVQKVDETIR